MPTATFLDADGLNIYHNGATINEKKLPATLYAQDIPSKNLLPNDLITTTYRGITYTKNSDGSITCTGSVSVGYSYSEVYLYFQNSIPDGNYILSGCPSGGSESTYRAILWDSDTGARAKAWDGTTNSSSDTGSGSEVQVIASHKMGYNIIIYGSITGTLTFYPMIRLASITDSTYVPYAKTNVELTKNIFEQEWDTVFATGSSTTCTLANFTASNYVFNWCSFYANRTKTSFRFLCRVRFDGVQRTGGSPNFTIQTNCHPSEAHTGYGGLRSAGGTTVQNASWGVDTLYWTIYPNGQLTVYMTETYTNIVNGNALYVIVFPIPSF